MRLASFSSFACALALGCLHCFDWDPTEVEDLGTFDERICIDPGTLELTPNGAQFIALRHRKTPSAYRAAWGEACAGTDDEDTKTKCLAELEALSAVGAGFTDHGDDEGDASAYDVVVTENGVARRIVSRDELVALLVPIDTPSEAVLVALAQDVFVDCNEDNVREVGGDYVLLTRVKGWCDSEAKRTVNVTPDGDILDGVTVGVLDEDCRR